MPALSYHLNTGSGSDDSELRLLESQNFLLRCVELMLRENAALAECAKSFELHREVL